MLTSFPVMFYSFIWGCVCLFLSPHQSSRSCCRPCSRCVVCVGWQLPHAEVLFLHRLFDPHGAAGFQQLPSECHSGPSRQTGRPQHPQTGEGRQHRTPLFFINMSKKYSHTAVHDIVCHCCWDRHICTGFVQACVNSKPLTLALFNVHWSW